MKHSAIEGPAHHPAFDWYQASIHAPEDNIIEAIIEHYGASMVSVRGIPQYDQSIGFCIPCYEEPVCELSFGGNQGAVPHVKATGHFAPSLATLIRRHWPAHSVSRVDSAYDFVGAGLYDQLRPILDGFHHSHGIFRNEMGFPENGRTYYLGSPKSPVRLRCYEKDKERQAKGLPFTDGHLRLELQVRPLTREKTKFAALDAAEIWGAAKWSRLVVNKVLAQSPEPIKREPTMSKSSEQILADVFSQYARRLHEVGEERAIALLKTFYASGTNGLSAALLEPASAN